MSSLIVDKKKLKKYVDASTTPTVLALFAIGLAGCGGGSSNVIPNTNPITQNDAVIINEDGSVVIYVLANDSDVYEDDFTITYLAATNGSVIINTDNTVTYTPNINYYGSDTITSSISDGNGGTAVSTVSVSIVEVNDSPVVSILIADDSTDEGVGYSYDASVNFSDVDVNDVLTYSAILSDSSALPSWISIDENSGILSSTLSNVDVGIINITVTASDGTLSASDTFQLEILEDLSGVASEGPLQQALVFLDLDGDDILDAGEAFDITNAQGEYTLTGISAADKAQGIQVDDAVDILRDIVFLDIIDTGSATWHAADVNNDGQIAADDAVAVLRHIVLLDEIDTFDLIDNTTGNRISSLDTNAIDVGQWTIVANGDVNQSSGFGDAYVVQVDIV